VEVAYGLFGPCAVTQNFPLGARHPLDFSPERWTCAIHALDGIFAANSGGTMSVPFQQSAVAHGILAELAAAIEEGYDKRALQRSPHLVLLNIEFYVEKLRPLMAQWMNLWLAANQLAGGLTPAMITAYLTGDLSPLEGVVWEASVEEGAASASGDGSHPSEAMRRLHAHMEAVVDKRSFCLLNLASDWVCLC
jgi:hypothetical protein